MTTNNKDKPLQTHTYITIHIIMCLKKNNRTNQAKSLLANQNKCFFYSIFDIRIEIQSYLNLHHIRPHFKKKKRFLSKKKLFQDFNLKVLIVRKNKLFQSTYLESHS